MTAIVGITDGRQVVIGGDSFGGNTTYGCIRSDPKVFKNGPYVLGFTSSFRMGQVLKYAGLPDPRGTDLHKFMSTKFIDGIRRVFKKAGIATMQNQTESCGTFLVGYKNRLFLIADDYQVGESERGYFAIGAGIEVASGALHVLTKHKNNANLRTKVLLALEAAAEHTPTVAGPMTILSTAS